MQWKFHVSPGDTERQSDTVCSVVMNVWCESHPHLGVTESVLLVFSQDLYRGIGADTADVDNGIGDGYLVSLVQVEIGDVLPLGVLPRWFIEAFLCWALYVCTLCHLCCVHFYNL